jgi:hypothetical protein
MSATGRRVLVQTSHVIRGRATRPRRWACGSQRRPSQRVTGLSRSLREQASVWSACGGSFGVTGCGRVRACVIHRRRAGLAHLLWLSGVMAAMRGPQPSGV